MKKIFILGLICMVAFTACSNGKNENNATLLTTKTEADGTTTSVPALTTTSGSELIPQGFEQLAQYFPDIEKESFRYSGTLEYDEIVVLENIEENNAKMILEFEGSWATGASVDEIEGCLEQGIYRKYIISNDSVTECFRKTRHFEEDYSEYESVEYREKVVLKLPLEEGNRWNTQYTINEDKYNAETAIVKIDPELQTIEVEIKVFGVEGYINEVYIEKNTFQIGKGLIMASYLTEQQEEYYIHLWIQDN